MRWGWIIIGALLLCALSSLMWLALVLRGSLVIGLVVAFALVAAVFAPAVIVGRRVLRARFAHGLLVGLTGWSMFLCLSLPITYVLTRTSGQLDRLSDHDHVQALQAVGLAAFLVALGGVATSPVMGLVSWIAGKLHDRATRREGEVPG